MSRAASAVLAVFVAFGALTAQDEDDLRDLGFALGDPQAPVTVVEFADFACEACGQFARDSWPAVHREFVETGKVRWRFIPFELGFRNSDEGIRAAQCAVEQDRFWDMHDALYERQEEWIGDRKPEDELEAIAADMGLEMEAYRHCWDEELGKERTEDANDAAKDRGIRATPSFFVNGKLVQGALPVAQFRKVLEDAEGHR